MLLRKPATEAAAIKSRMGKIFNNKKNLTIDTAYSGDSSFVKSIGTINDSQY
jgi:hypothetical protein